MAVNYQRFQHFPSRRGRTQRHLEALEDRRFLTIEANWAIDLGTGGADTPMAFAVDQNDNSYVAVGIGQDVMIKKRDASGGTPSNWNLTSNIPAGGTLMVTELDVRAETAGSYLYAAGVFTGSATVGVGGTATLTATGGKDAFVAKLDALNGSVIWAQRLGGAADDEITGMDVNETGVYVAGTFSQAITFGTSTTPILTSTVGNSIGSFVLKAAPDSGTLQAVEQLQTSGSFTPTDLDIANDGNLLIGGFFGKFGEAHRNKVVFSTDTGTKTYTTGGYTDAIVLKYTTAGNIAWATQIAKGSGNQFSNLDGLSETSEGTIYAAGRFRGHSVPTFFGTDQLTATSSSPDGFVVKLSSAGQHQSVQQINSSGYVAAVTVAVRDIETRNTVFVSGMFSGDLGVGPAGYAPLLQSRGGLDVFLLELQQDNLSEVAVYASGGTGTENTNLYTSFSDPSEFAVVVSSSGSVYQLVRTNSDLIQTPGGSVLTAGGVDPVLVHLNPQALQFSVRPSVGGTGTYGASPLVVEQSVTKISVTVTDLGGTTSLPDIDTNLSLGRTNLTVNATTASYPWTFDVSPKAPDLVQARVTLSGKQSTVRLTWTDKSSGLGQETGFVVERSSLDYDANGQLAPNLWTSVKSTNPETEQADDAVNKNGGLVAYRVRSYYQGLTGPMILSPVWEYVVVNPALSGTYSPTSASSAIGFAVLGSNSETRQEMRKASTLSVLASPQAHVYAKATILCPPAPEDVEAAIAEWNERSWDSQQANDAVGGHRIHTAAPTEFDLDWMTP